MTDDPFDLARFVSAQAPVFDRALAEIEAGRKRTHWMWFVFPQIAGLGSSFRARKFAIGSLAEAEAYLAHPLLGQRLRRCTDAMNTHDGVSALAILGAPDDMKFRSSMTLFGHAAPEEKRFAEALLRYFNGEPDAATLSRLG